MIHYQLTRAEEMTFNMILLLRDLFELGSSILMDDRLAE